ncbi:unnamed protein product [Trichogramma brassicae]|uniref:Uncharacterized protein n=1 Tax=Trichogramma brassicae TaxID=86971 RepID=A0A6H5IZ11_9HYME|nr:unnamed protein product [Trichogramma brassicae]
MSINRNYFEAIGRRAYVAIKKFGARHARRRPRFIVRVYADNNSRASFQIGQTVVLARLSISLASCARRIREREREKKTQLKQLEHDPFHFRLISICGLQVVYVYYTPGVNYDRLSQSRNSSPRRHNFAVVAVAATRARAAPRDLAAVQLDACSITLLQFNLIKYYCACRDGRDRTYCARYRAIYQLTILLLPLLLIRTRELGLAYCGLQPSQTWTAHADFKLFMHTCTCIRVLGVALLQRSFDVLVDLRACVKGRVRSVHKLPAVHETIWPITSPRAPGPGATTAALSLVLKKASSGFRCSARTSLNKCIKKARCSPCARALALIQTLFFASLLDLPIWSYGDHLLGYIITHAGKDSTAYSYHSISCEIRAKTSSPLFICMIKHTRKSTSADRADLFCQRNRQIYSIRDRRVQQSRFSRTRRKTRVWVQDESRWCRIARCRLTASSARRRAEGGSQQRSFGPKFPSNEDIRAQSIAVLRRELYTHTPRRRASIARVSPDDDDNDDSVFNLRRHYECSSSRHSSFEFHLHQYNQHFLLIFEKFIHNAPCTQNHIDLLSFLNIHPKNSKPIFIANLPSQLGLPHQQVLVGMPMTGSSTR